MKLITLIAFTICVCCIIGLKTLKKQEIGDKYQIGTISDLYFRIEDKIFFRSDDDLFGFISQKDGSLMEVYELEADQQIIKFIRTYEIAIAKNKSLNIFLTPNSVYKPLRNINKYLDNHSDYTKIIDFFNGGDMSVSVLTDKYLLKISFDMQTTLYQDKIMIELKNPSQTFFALVPFLNVALSKQDIYLASIIKDSAVSKICFRKASNIQADAVCFQISKDDAVVDIVDSMNYIYIEFQKYALAITTDLRFVDKIDSKPLHYFNGLISLDSTHQFYDPSVKKFYNTIIIVEHEAIFRQVKTLKIQQKSMLIQERDRQNFIDVLSIPKDPKQNPRKVWSHTQKDNIKKFRLFVEFEDGRLVCYSIDRQTKKYEQVWKITTIQANKVVTGQIEAKDIEGDDDKDAGEDIQGKAKP